MSDGDRGSCGPPRLRSRAGVARAGRADPRTDPTPARPRATLAARMRCAVMAAEATRVWPDRVARPLRCAVTTAALQALSASRMTSGTNRARRPARAATNAVIPRHVARCCKTARQRVLRTRATEAGAGARQAQNARAEHAPPRPTLRELRSGRTFACRTTALRTMAAWERLPIARALTAA